MNNYIHGRTSVYNINYHCCGRLHPEMKEVSIRTIECDKCGMGVLALECHIDYVRAYPNKEQQMLINKTFGCCRLRRN